MPFAQGFRQPNSALTDQLTTMSNPTFLNPKPLDPRPQKGMWAPGEYMNNCIRCHEAFIGDKRAQYCADCAYADENPSGIEAMVCADITARQKLGIAKYGTTVMDNPLTLAQWLEHAYQECLDQAVYLKRAMEQLKADAEWHDEEEMVIKEPIETSDLRWEYEDQLPEMDDETFKTIFKASRVDAVRMYPYVEDSKGNRIWITHLPGRREILEGWVNKL